MLDLDALERKINAALEKETPESLLNWLMSKRASEIQNYIGEGDYIPHGFVCLESTEQLIIDSPVLIKFELEANSSNAEFSMAA